MINYFKLIVSPSNFIDKLNDKQPSNLSIFIIWILGVLSVTLPNTILTMKTNDLELGYLPLYIIALMFLYYPVVYGFSYSFWVVGKGFKGLSKFIEIRNSFVLSLIPSIFYLPISLIFIVIGLINSDMDLLAHKSYITQAILWILSFRILITGIAKYNKFNWTITLVNWFIVIFVIGGIYYLIKH